MVTTKIDFGNRVALSGLVVYTTGNYDPEHKAAIERFLKLSGF